MRANIGAKSTRKGTSSTAALSRRVRHAGLIGPVGQANYGSCKAALALLAIAIDNEMAKYGSDGEFPSRPWRGPTDDRRDGRLRPRCSPAGEARGIRCVRALRTFPPLIVWLASDDAKDVHVESSVWVAGPPCGSMKGWHSVGRVYQRAVWDAADLGQKLKAELAKGLTARDLREADDQLACRNTLGAAPRPNGAAPPWSPYGAALSNILFICHANTESAASLPETLLRRC